MQVRRTRSRIVVASAALLVPAAMLLTTQAATAAPGPLVKIDSTYPRWLAKSKSLRAASVPAASSAKRMTVRVYLTPKGGQAALEAKVAAVSDPASADYNHFLSTAQYAKAYGPTKAAASTVSSYLKSKGLKVTGVEAHRRYVAASGTVKQLDKAFNVSLKSYSHDGQKVTAPSAAAALPATVASSVLTVSGLDTTTTKMTHRQTPKVTPPASFVNARPCSLSYGQIAAKYQADYKTPLPAFQGQTLPYVTCGYTGPLLREAYTPGTKLTGAGVTVAITDAYQWQLIAKDANRYAEENGDGSYVDGQFTESPAAAYTNQKLCDPSGWSGEETLDVEAVHAMAPDAKIRYYASASCLDEDFGDTLGRVVDENVAKVVTNSWSDVEAAETTDGIVAYEQVFLQGALQGISFLFSSGDSGDNLAGTGQKQVDYPASDPYATAVGGTSTGISAAGKKIFDTGWGTVKYNLSKDGKSWESIGFTSGAGGGYSALFNRPTYQQGVVPASAPPGRAVPDIAMDADPNTGFLVGQTQTFPDSVHYGEYRIGGTSLASPLLAGMTALAIEQNGGRGFGALNPKLYGTKGVADDVINRPARVGVVRADYTDTTDSNSPVIYSVRAFGQDSSLKVTKGWDPVTGLGVPNAAFLKLATAPASPVTTTAKR